ncbi:MAG TPA: dTMP kinase [Candidatus Olsenella pullicola]|nr:dTMP kinase [Candidatus Olsenella pullicola]
MRADGVFITLEGADGCGKSTQAELIAPALEAAGREVVRLREPGGTPISEKIRAILLDPENAEMCDQCELMLYEASRAQLTREVIEPALARGAVVLCDRYYDSTYAYQAGGRSLSDELVRRANALGSCGRTPDRTLVFDLDPATAYARATAGGADRMEAEGLAFQERVRTAYLRLAEEEPARVRVVDASGDKDAVLARALDALADLVDVGRA